MRKKGRFQCLLWRCQSPETGADLSLQQVWLPIEMFCYSEQELQGAQMDVLYPHFALLRPFKQLPFNQIEDEPKYTSQRTQGTTTVQSKNKAHAFRVSTILSTAMVFTVSGEQKNLNFWSRSFSPESRGLRAFCPAHHVHPETGLHEDHFIPSFLQHFGDSLPD